MYMPQGEGMVVCLCLVMTAKAGERGMLRLIYGKRQMITKKWETFSIWLHVTEKTSPHT